MEDQSIKELHHQIGEGLINFAQALTAAVTPVVAAVSQFCDTVDLTDLPPNNPLRLAIEDYRTVARK